MSVVDAQTARAMAQKIQRAMPGINYTFFDQHPLLKIAKKKGNLQWKGSHTEFEWFIYKNDDTAPDWGGGELSINTFEEQDPATRAHLPYCWLQKNYGVSDKTMEANRHSPDKAFEPLKANLKLAKINIYKTIGPAIWNGGLTGDGGTTPVGLKWAVGDCYEGSSVITVTAARSYANKTLNTSAIAAYSAARAGFDEPQWAPEVIDIHEVPNVSAAPKWSVDCLLALSYMEEEMKLTADLTGTGEQQKPDSAFMSRDPFHALKAKAVTNQVTYGIPAQLANEDLLLANWTNIRVGELLCILDNDVPADPSTAYERVMILDTSKFKIKTTHTKKEGLIRNDFDENNVMINGVVGALKANMGWYIQSPTAIGCICGCND